MQPSPPEGRRAQRAFAPAFAAGDPAAAPFLTLDARRPEDRARKVAELAGRTTSPALIEALLAQDAALPPSPSRRRAILALARPGTLAVVTGQQVGLFLGPLYTVYKAATAIVAARALAAETGATVVPMFWLQTEDHDFAEIASTHVLDRTGRPQVLTAGSAEPAARIAVAQRHLAADVTQTLAQLRDALPPGPAADQTLAWLAEAYRPGVTWPAAFAHVLARLFADRGLVILDPRTPAVAAVMAPLLRRALREAGPIAELLAARATALRAAGFAVQVRVRAGSPLVFLHDGAPTGPRFRLSPRGEGRFALSGAGVVDPAAIAAAAEREPMLLSTSALLRPVVQDAILPVAAYVGGPGEVNYFAQLGPLYDHFGVAQPLVLPRAGFRVVDRKTRDRLQVLGLSSADVGRPRRELVTRIAAGLRPGGAPAPATLRAETLARLGAELDGLAAQVGPVDAGLERPLRRTRTTVLGAAERLFDRYAAAVAHKESVALGRLDRVLDALMPDGVPQERRLGWPQWAGRLGVAAFEEAVLGAIDPFARDRAGARDLDVAESA